MITCGYCGKIETKAEARECGRLDAELENDTPADREAPQGHRFDTW